MWCAEHTRKLQSSEELVSQFLTEIPPFITVLDGPSGCGKTRLVKALQCHFPVRVFSTEAFIDILLSYAKGDVSIPEGRIIPADEPYICFEDIDLLAGKSATLHFLFCELIRMENDKTVIISGIDIRHRLPGFLEKLEKFFAVNVYLYHEERKLDDVQGDS